VGSTGKIGSYILHKLNKPITSKQYNTDNSIYPQSLNVAAVPRGVSPGCLSTLNTPIYAAVPSSSTQSVWESTIPDRRKDLVFCCNCIPSRHLNFGEDVTVAILHFGVSHDNTNGNPRLNTSQHAPPTIIYGRHAQTLANLFNDDGIPTIVVNNPREIQIAAAKKIAWSSLMWLMCHSFNNGNGPLTVKEIHETKSGEMNRLVEEIMPALEALASEPWTRNSKTNVSSSLSIGSVQDILDYLETYSMSISNGNVIPNKKLALEEIHERNGLLLSLSNNEQESYHMALLRKVVGEDLDQYLASKDEDKDVSDSSQRVKLTSSDLEFLFHTNKSNLKDTSTIKSAVVVGAGMFGSSIAHHLSRLGVKVMVLDERKNLLPSKSDDDDIDPGTATSSSFAWINGNSKTPLSYKQLNCLGMEVWRRHGVLKDLPVWCGTLVRSTIQDGDSQSSIMSAYYSCVGPLDMDELSELEPGIDLSSAISSDDTEIHFYPEEGHVDPVQAVKVLRTSANENEVDFIEGAVVTDLVRDEQGRVVGVEYTKTDDVSTQTVTADTVIIAAGANSAKPELGLADHLTLLEKPGKLAYAKTNADSKTLDRIFVDKTSQFHILRRSDTIVVGGGKMVAGGDTKQDSTIESQSSSDVDVDSQIGKAMVDHVISAIAPYELQNGYELERVSQANRAFPKDGFPVIGWVDDGLYSAVTHSGITLGPLLGELVAYEVSQSKLGEKEDKNNSGFQILDKYRPSKSRMG